MKTSAEASADREKISRQKSQDWSDTLLPQPRPEGRLRNLSSQFPVLLGLLCFYSGNSARTAVCVVKDAGAGTDRTYCRMRG